MTSEGSSLHGDHVCVYRITESGVQEISDDGVFTVLRDGAANLTEQAKTLVVKKCCPGFRVTPEDTCVETRVSNPFAESQFSYALIYLGLLLAVVGVLSMFIAYRYHYRFQRNKKDGLINNSFDDHGTTLEPVPKPSSDPEQLHLR